MFSYKKYTVLIQARMTQHVNSIFLNGNLVLAGFLKIIGVQNQLPITFIVLT